MRNTINSVQKNVFQQERNIMGIECKIGMLIRSFFDLDCVHSQRSKKNCGPKKRNEKKERNNNIEPQSRRIITRARPQCGSFAAELDFSRGES